MGPERQPFPTLVAVLSLAALPPPASAQQLSRLSQFDALSVTPDEQIGARLFTVEPGDSVKRVQKTHWLEGALIGGGILGVLGAAFGGGMCSYDETDDGPCWDEALLGGVLGFGIGFSAGGLIGGQFPKSTEPTEAGTPIERDTLTEASQ
jgi:hypothetical protein